MLQVGHFLQNISQLIYSFYFICFILFRFISLCFVPVWGFLIWCWVVLFRFLFRFSSRNFSCSRFKDELMNLPTPSQVCEDKHFKRVAVRAFFWLCHINLKSDVFFSVFYEWFYFITFWKTILFRPILFEITHRKWVKLRKTVLGIKI